MMWLEEIVAGTRIREISGDEWFLDRDDGESEVSKIFDPNVNKPALIPMTRAAFEAGMGVA